MPRVRMDVDSDYLVQQYIAGESVLQLAKDVGASRAVVESTTRSVRNQLRSRSRRTLRQMTLIAHTFRCSGHAPGVRRGGGVHALSVR